MIQRRSNAHFLIAAVAAVCIAEVSMAAIVIPTNQNGADAEVREEEIDTSHAALSRQQSRRQFRIGYSTDRPNDWGDVGSQQRHVFEVRYFWN